MLAFCRRRPSALQTRRKVASCTLTVVCSATATRIEDHVELIRQINSLGSLSKYKETAELISRVHLDPIIRAAIQHFKDGGKNQAQCATISDSSFNSSRYTTTNAFAIILDSLIYVRSEKVLDVISYAKSDAVVANLVGATRLLRVCNILYNVSLDQNRKNVESQRAALSISWKLSAQQFSFDDLADNCPNSKSGMKRNSRQVEIEFAQLFSPCLMIMTPLERWYHIRTIVKDMTYKITNTSSIRLIKTQIFHLHEELENINIRCGHGNVDMTVIGDVAMASFDAFRFDGKVEKSVNLLTELVAASK